MDEEEFAMLFRDLAKQHELDKNIAEKLLQRILEILLRKEGDGGK